MSRTPRTDALAARQLAELDRPLRVADHKIELWNLARELERALTEAKDIAAQLASEAAVSRGAIFLSTTEVVGQDGKPVAAPCAIDGCQLARNGPSFLPSGFAFTPSVDGVDVPNAWPKEAIDGPKSEPEALVAWLATAARYGAEEALRRMKLRLDLLEASRPK